MKILLYDQRKCYLNLVIKKLKHYFKGEVHIFICNNSQELNFYENQIINIIIVDNEMNLEIVRLLKIMHYESQIVCIGNSYYQIHEIIKLGISDYLLMPKEVETLCESLRSSIILNTKWSIPMKENGRKHIFVLDEIEYVKRDHDDFIIMTVNHECFMTSVKNYYFLKQLLIEYFMQMDQNKMISFQFVDYLKNYQMIMQSCEKFQISNQNLKKEKEKKYERSSR